MMDPEFEECREKFVSSLERLQSVGQRALHCLNTKLKNINQQLQSVNGQTESLSNRMNGQSASLERFVSRDRTGIILRKHSELEEDCLLKQGEFRRESTEMERIQDWIVRVRARIKDTDSALCAARETRARVSEERSNAAV
eukprot:98850_1